MDSTDIRDYDAAVELKDRTRCPYPLSDFGSALQALRDRFRVARRSWRGRELYIELMAAQAWNAEGCIIPLIPILVMKTSVGAFVAWHPSASDVLSTDWEAV
jgi:hypothetical protein